MILANIDPKAWIVAMFIRDDGERLLLGDGKYDFNADQLHYGADTLANDVVELQGANGQILAGQVRRSTAQDFDGFIGTATNSKQEIEQWRRDFFRFFAIGHLYTAVYVSCPKTLGAKNYAIARKRGYLVEAPEVRELYQVTPEYHVALAFEDVNYYEYEEDNNGDEIYANSATIYVGGEVIGGLVWDDQGVVWDPSGAIWEGVEMPDTQTVVNEGVASCPFVWEVDGYTKNPTLQNLTTGKAIQYSGEIQNGSKLIIDMSKQTALLDGENVFNRINGDWLTLAPGDNRINYSVTGSSLDTKSSMIKWNSIVG